MLTRLIESLPKVKQLEGVTWESLFLGLQSKDVGKADADQRCERDGESQKDENHPDEARHSPAEVELGLG
jgi:hypothetical protein